VFPPLSPHSEQESDDAACCAFACKGLDAIPPSSIRLIQRIMKVTVLVFGKIDLNLFLFHSFELQCSFFVRIVKPNIYENFEMELGN
jgi:hypothetical protein